MGRVQKHIKCLLEYIYIMYAPIIFDNIDITGHYGIGNGRRK